VSPGAGRDILLSVPEVIDVSSFDSMWPFALGLTVLAGLATGIGSLAAIFAKRTNTSFLAASLGFSAGVMIYVSFTELLPAGARLLETMYGTSTGPWVVVLSFVGGMITIAIIDFLVPTAENPHEAAFVEDLSEENPFPELQRVGVLTAFAIAIHNFPEGLATFASALHDVRVGIPIAIAIALHNVPEGVSVAIPIYYATGSRRKAFWYSFLSGLAEPTGALLGLLVIRAYWSGALLGVLDAAVAGIMVFVSLDQLIPNAKRYETGHYAVYGLIWGFALMAIALVIL
jgi:ZIP family zinc transporter